MNETQDSRWITSLATAFGVFGWTAALAYVLQRLDYSPWLAAAAALVLLGVVCAVWIASKLLERAAAATYLKRIESEKEIVPFDPLVDAEKLEEAWKAALAQPHPRARAAPSADAAPGEPA